MNFKLVAAVFVACICASLLVAFVVKNKIYDATGTTLTGVTKGAFSTKKA